MQKAWVQRFCPHEGMRTGLLRLLPAKLPGYALGLRPQPKPPGYPLGPALAPALIRGRLALGPFGLAANPICGGIYKGRSPPAIAWNFVGTCLDSPRTHSKQMSPTLALHPRSPPSPSLPGWFEGPPTKASPSTHTARPSGSPQGALPAEASSYLVQSHLLYSGRTPDCL